MFACFRSSMATATRLSVTQLSDVLGTEDELRLSMVFLLAQVDPGADSPALETENTLASNLVKALGCEATLVDFVSIPRACIEKCATGIEFIPTGDTESRVTSFAEIGRCLRAWDFALEVTCIPVGAVSTEVKPPAASAASAASAAKTIKLSSFICSDLEGTTQILSSEEITIAEGVYKTRLGILPQEAAMPSEEQLSALHFVLANDMTPYVDFALWGPFNRRFIRRKSAMVSYTPDITDGSWKPSHKLTGPASFEAWLADWIVFRTAMVMLEGAEPERLDQYAGFIRELYEKHTARCWWLIYQADTRLRSERLGRIVRKSAADGAAHMNTRSRWSFAFTKAIDMEVAGMAEFWNNEVHRPAGEFKAGLSSHQDLAKDGTHQWLQPQGSPNKRQRRRGNGDGGGFGAPTPTGGNTWQQSWPSAWDQVQPAQTPWNVMIAQPKDGGKGTKNKEKGKPTGKNKGNKGRGGKGKGAKGAPGAPPPPPPAPAVAGAPG